MTATGDQTIHLSEDVSAIADELKQLRELLVDKQLDLELLENKWREEQVKLFRAEKQVFKLERELQALRAAAEKKGLN